MNELSRDEIIPWIHTLDLSELDEQFPLISSIYLKHGIDIVIEISRAVRSNSKLHSALFDVYPNSEHPIWVATDIPENAFKLITWVYEREFMLLHVIDDYFDPSSPFEELIDSIGLSGIESLLGAYEVQPDEFDFSLLQTQQISNPNRFESLSQTSRPKLIIEQSPSAPTSSPQESKSSTPDIVEYN